MTGKSWTAQAYGTKAISMGYSVLYLRVPRLMQYLQSIRGDEEYLKYLVRLKRINLLILDAPQGYFLQALWSEPT